METLDDGSPTSDGAIAYVKWGFCHAFRHLSHRSSFMKALREILKGGGDADTNCGIVCGLIGARFGIQNIEKMAQSVITCDSSNNQAVPGVSRPHFLRAALLPKYLDSLLRIAPDKLSFQYPHF